MIMKVRAIWDTGASVTIISKAVAETLGIELTQTTSRLRTALGLESNVPDGEAWITIVLGSFPIKMKVKVLDNVCSDKDIDIVLGLDFMAKGDFFMTTDSGQLMFSFCYPSGFPMNFHEALTKLDIPHAHFEDENADGDLASAIRNGESLKMNYKP